MGMIGNIKKAVGGFVKEAGQKTGAAATAMARAPVLDAKLLKVNMKLAELKGWGPEIKAQRQGLEQQRNSIQQEIKENRKAIPNSMDIARNIKA